MKTSTLVLILSLICKIGLSQEIVEWKETTEITENSFRAQPPVMAEDQLQQYSFSATFDFNFQMLSMQFALTKNFNSYVRAYYVPTLSWMESGELTEQLLIMANLDFDLVELYARKFRKRLYETKNLGSNVNFYNIIYNEISREYSDHQTVIQSEIRNNEKFIEYLKTENDLVNKEIKELNEFCKMCKPLKKKRRK